MFVPESLGWRVKRWKKLGRRELQVKSILFYVLCGHIICDDNNNNIANNKKKEEDEDESAHLPAGTPTGCVSSSPAAEADGEGGKRGGRGAGGNLRTSQYIHSLIGTSLLD